MKRAACLALPLLLAAQDAPRPYALATLDVLADGKYTLVTSVEVPREKSIHTPESKDIAFEGPGWETDRVAYRLYLDARNVPDIYGKKLPGPILPRIGKGVNDYSAMADWGMDILQVGQSLGAGGIGVLRDNKISQLGPADIRASVTNTPGGASSVRVESRGFAGMSGPADMVATYSIDPGSRVTRVDAAVSGSVPWMIAGMVRHPGTVVLQGHSRKWTYVGTWGNQSLAKDGLGMAFFYPLDSASNMQATATDVVVTFCDPRQFHYAFAAAWAQEPGAPRTAHDFKVWMHGITRQLDVSDPRPSGCMVVKGITALQKRPGA